ncbi:MAG: DUF2953 domain-containing protein [Pseudomonadota bacterium]
MLIVLGLLLLSIIALLTIPVALSFQLTWQQAFHGSLKVNWLFGLVRIPVTLPITGTAKTKGQTRHKSRAPRKKQNLGNLFRQKPLRRRAFRFIRDFWRAIDKRGLSLHLRVGLGDPADTGQLWAFVGPLAALASNTREASIRFEPDFFDTAFEMQSSGEIRFVPLYLIYLTLGLLLSAPVIRAIKQSRAVA